MLRALNMLRDGRNSNCAAETDYRSQQPFAVSRFHCGRNKCSIELDLVELKLPQVPDGSIAGAEIVKHDQDPGAPQRLQVPPGTSEVRQ